MFQDIRRNVAAIRSTEYAAIARWFSPSPVGLLFHGPDGTAKPIAPDKAEARRADAERVVDGFLEDMPAQGPLFLGMIFGTMVIVWCIADLFGFSKAGAIPVGFGIGAAAAHAVELYSVYLMRQRLRAIRNEIADDLRATAPVPAAIGARYRRTNPFQTALVVLVSVIGVFGMLAMHDEWLLTAIPMGVYVVVVPVAWLLFALSKHRDATSGVTKARLN